MQKRGDRHMDIAFKKASDFNRGILFELLSDAYSFDRNYENTCKEKWQENENFFFDNLQIADKFCFITTLNDEAIGYVSWDPRNMPAYAEIGDNCIITKHKGNGYGKLQLQEAINRIKQYKVEKIIVTTDDGLIPAQRMYESVGFTMHRKRNNGNIVKIDYVLSLQ